MTPDLASEIETALEGISDPRVLAHIRSQLVQPKLVMRLWDYGEPGQRYPCWTVLEDCASRTGIAYCDQGFGPRCPWGLVFLGEPDDPETSMGMDSGWYPRFLDAYFESSAPRDLRIWRIMRGPPASGVPITDEMAWEDAWQLVEEVRTEEPTAFLYVDQTAVEHRRLVTAAPSPA